LPSDNAPLRQVGQYPLPLARGGGTRAHQLIAAFVIGAAQFIYDNLPVKILLEFYT